MEWGVVERAVVFRSIFGTLHVEVEFRYTGVLPSLNPSLQLPTAEGWVRLDPEGPCLHGARLAPWHGYGAGPTATEPRKDASRCHGRLGSVTECKVGDIVPDHYKPRCGP